MLILSKKSEHYDNAIHYPFGYVCTLPYALDNSVPCNFMETDQGTCDMHTDAWKLSMTPERYKELTEPILNNTVFHELSVSHERMEEPKLTEEEARQWCFCSEFDGMLIHVSEIQSRVCNNNCNMHRIQKEQQS
jgi:hypothetical protein